MKLKGVEDTDILPGFILCSIESPCHVGRIFDAEVHISYFLKIYFIFNKIIAKS